MRFLRFRRRTYRASRVGAKGWELTADGEQLSSHRSFREAVGAAEAHDQRRRRNREAVKHAVLMVVAGLLLIPTMGYREVDNDDFPPARAFADGMEEAYGDVDAGVADIAQYTVEEDGFGGGVFRVVRGGVENDYLLLVGDYRGDCYVIRWVRSKVPFVARLLPRYDCEPGQPALNFAPSGFEAIAINLSAGKPLNWEPVLPDQIRLAPWFFPAVFVVMLVVMQQMISLSLVFIRRGVFRKAVPVERVDKEPAE